MSSLIESQRKKRREARSIGKTRKELRRMELRWNRKHGFACLLLIFFVSTLVVFVVDRIDLSRQDVVAVEIVDRFVVVRLSRRTERRRIALVERRARIRIALIIFEKASTFLLSSAMLAPLIQTFQSIACSTFLLRRTIYKIASTMSRTIDPIDDVYRCLRVWSSSSEL